VNNFVRKCLLSSTSNKVSLLGEEDEFSVFKVFKVSANQNLDSSFLALKVLSGDFICFEIDTGAKCNVLSIHTNKKPTSSMLRQPSLPL